MNFEDAVVRSDWAIRRVMEQINRNGQGIAVVSDDLLRPLATVTDGDIRRAILARINLDLPIQALLEQRSPDLQRKPIVAKLGSDEAELLRLMSDAWIRHVPIVDTSGRMVDIAVLAELIREYELPVTAVVMAGGYGTRLQPLTQQVPKPMLPVGGRPLLELIIEQLQQAGIRQVNLTTHYKKEAIVEHFGDGHNFGVAIDYVEEDQPLGTAGSLSRLQRSETPFLVINGDILTRVDFRAMLDFHREHQADLTVGVRLQESCLPYGVVQTDGVFVISITEKPVTQHLINAAIYLLDPKVCEYIPHDQTYDMTDLIDRLLTEGRRVVSFPVSEYWIDIGRDEDYRQAQLDAKAEGIL